MQIPGYRIIRKINHGGMSTVYLAIQESVGRVVALKVMSPALNGDPTFSERFQREANIVGQLSHPHIVSIYDIGRHNNYNYIAMDYLPGGSIHDKMLSGIGAEQALRILKEIGSALDHAHEKGYVHRDIKPENILFRDDGSAVLTDFGVARAQATHSRATHAGTVVGTPHYMSPEQTRGKAVDARSDLYSLGIVFYEMLTGAVPYQGDEAVSIALKHLASPLPTLPAQFIRFQPILDKLLDKDPARRYQRGLDLVADIEVLQLLMRDQGEQSLASGAGLAGQFGNLFSVLLRKIRSRLNSQLRQGLTFLGSLRYSKARGFHRVATVQQSLSDSLTQQNTLVETRIHRQFGGPAWLRFWRDIPTRQRMILMSALALVGLSLVLLAWLGHDEPTAPSTPLLTGEKSSDESARSAASEPASATEHSDAEISSASTPAFDLDTKLDTDTIAADTQAGTETNSDMPSEEPVPLLSAVEPAQASSSASSEPAPATPAEALSVSEASSRASEPEVAQRFALTVSPTPSEARVRVMNIREKYTDAMALKPGNYHIEVTHPGYRKYLEWVRIKEADLNHKVSLLASRSPGSEFSDSLKDGGKGPVMVVVPEGSFAMGGADENASPVHQVTIDSDFAISKYEVTFAQYERFANHQSMPLPGDNRWGRDNRPVINVSWEEAQMYADWLSDQTGKRYRLPSEAEWEYVARGGKESAFWWGDSAREAAGKANCRRYCDSSYTGLFSGETAPVGEFPANAFGIHDTAGNVAEWVQDCYRENYQNAGQNPEAFNQDNCPARVVRGGSLKDDAQELRVYARSYQPQHTYHENVGIRLVVEQF